MAPIAALRGLRPSSESAAWRTRANCTSFDVDDFMPTGTHGRYRNDVKQACETCPVRQQCLETALNSPWPPYGLWAGKSARELERLWFNQHPNYRTVMANLGVPTTEDQQQEVA